MADNSNALKLNMNGPSINGVLVSSSMSWSNQTEEGKETKFEI